MENMTQDEKALLVAILKRAGDEDLTEWLQQEKQVWDTFKAASDNESVKTRIETAYQQLLKKIEDAIVKKALPLLVFMAFASCVSSGQQSSTVQPNNHMDKYLDLYHSIEQDDAVIYNVFMADGTNEPEWLLVVSTFKGVKYIAQYIVGILYKNTADVWFIDYDEFESTMWNFPEYSGLCSVTVLAVDDKSETITVGINDPKSPRLMIKLASQI